MRRRALIGLAVLLSILPLLFQTSGAGAQQGSAGGLVVVFDGSGSMWGRIEGTKDSKFAVGREALRQSLAQLAPTTPVALASFGHRRRGDCSDVEILVPAAPRDLDKLMPPLDRLNPKGKGPIAAALRESAAAMGDNPRATILLIHDSADNCQQDPCAVAAEIVKAQPGLVIHSVGLAIEPEEQARAACIGRSGNGRSVLANDAATASRAIADLVRLANLDPAPAAAAPAPQRAPPATAPLPDPSKDGPPRLALAASLDKASGALTLPIDWKVMNADGRTALAATAPSLTEPLPAGRYTVEARVGLVRATAEVTVAEKGITAPRIVLDAGLIDLLPHAAKASEPLADAVVTLRADAKGATGDDAPLVLHLGPLRNLVVPPGAYRASVRRGLVERTASITLAAGGRASVDLALDSGALSLAAAGADETDVLDKVLFIVEEDDPEQPQGRREVLRTSAARPSLVLPAGTYALTARAGAAEARQRVAIGAGDSINRTMVLGAARVQISIAQHASAKPAATVIRALTLDTPPREMARASGEKAEFLLPAGRYRLEAASGGINARSDRVLEVKPGKPVQVGLAIPAGEVHFKTTGAGPPLADSYWEIRDQQGRIVWRSVETDPRALLAPGRYTVRLEARSRQGTRNFELKPGEALTLDVPAE